MSVFTKRWVIKTVNRYDSVLLYTKRETLIVFTTVNWLYLLREWGTAFLKIQDTYKEIEKCTFLRRTT